MNDILSNAIRRFDYQKAMPTPWGKADNKHKICEGVYNVGTPSHGGIMVGKTVAKKLLSAKAQAIGMDWGTWLCYEEDCDWAVFAYEQPKLYSEAWNRENPLSFHNEEENKKEARSCLETWHADYFV